MILTVRDHADSIFFKTCVIPVGIPVEIPMGIHTGIPMGISTGIPVEFTWEFPW